MAHRHVVNVKSVQREILTVRLDDDGAALVTVRFVGAGVGKLPEPHLICAAYNELKAWLDQHGVEPLPVPNDSVGQYTEDDE